MVKWTVMLPLEILASWFVGVSRILHLSHKHDVPEVRTPFKEKDRIYQKTLNDILHSLLYTTNMSTSTWLRARWGQQITAHLFSQLQSLQHTRCARSAQHGASPRSRSAACQVPWHSRILDTSCLFAWVSSHPSSQLCFAMRLECLSTDKETRPLLLLPRADKGQR